MHDTVRAALSGTIAALVLVATAACEGSRERPGDVAADSALATPPAAAPAPFDTPATSPTATPTTTLRVVNVDLGRAVRGDTAVVDDIDDFSPTDTIHAIVRHEGAGQDVTITARWTFQDGQVVDESTETVSPSGAAAAYTHFMISKASPWPTGQYRLHVLVNGQQVETEEFEVK